MTPLPSGTVETSGAPLPNCRSHPGIGAAPEEQVFQGYGYRFVIGKALRLLAGRTPNNQVVVAECADMLRMVGINKQHALGPDIDLTKPLIVVWFPHLNGGMVIDGWHRIYRATVEGVAELPSYLLTLEEADAIREDRMPPFVPRPDDDDDEADEND
jgi:hypothetical protein